jgi:hypothetical protein
LREKCITNLARKIFINNNIKLIFPRQISVFVEEGQRHLNRFEDMYRAGKNPAILE